MRRAMHRALVGALLLGLVAAPAVAAADGPRLLYPRRDLRRTLQQQGQQGPLIAVVGAKVRGAPIGWALRGIGRALAHEGMVALVNASLSEGKTRSIARQVVAGAKRGGGITVGYSNWRTAEQHRLDGFEHGLDLLRLTRRPQCLRRGVERPNTAARAIEMVERSDGVIIAGGGAEALLQFSVAYQKGLAVGVLEGSGGITTRIKRLVKAFDKAGKKSAAPLVFERDAGKLVQKLARAIRARESTGPLTEGGAALDDKAARAILEEKDEHPQIVGPGENPLDLLPPPGPGQGRIVFGLYGGADPRAAGDVTAKNHEVARAITSIEGWQAVGQTGACPGIPDEIAEAILGQEGLVVGTSPYRTLEKHVRAGRAMNLTVLQLTRGMDEPNLMPREIDNVVLSDVSLISGGRNGTLGELALSLLMDRPVGVIRGTGGITGEIPAVLKALAAAGEDYRDRVFFDEKAQTVIDRLVRTHAARQR